MTFSPKKFLTSFRHAWRGLYDVAKAEQSFRIQLVGGIGVLACAVALPFLTWERVTLVLFVVGVLVLEIINTIFERLADAVHPRLHGAIREVKDMMAGAVLLASLAAVGGGGLILFPRIYALLSTW